MIPTLFKVYAKFQGYITSQNVGAGITRGLVYCLDKDASCVEKVNSEIIKIQQVKTAVREAFKE